MIGLGDFSLWRVLFLGCFIYFFIVLLFMLFFNIVIGIILFVGRWYLIVRFFCIVIVGYIMYFCLFRYLVGLFFLGIIFCMIIIRLVFVILYIYVNIF